MPSGDFPAEMFVYGGSESTAVDKGIYYVAVRALLAPSANHHTGTSQCGSSLAIPLRVSDEWHRMLTVF
ncbi:hypothetical protein SCLCIDRAFT_1210376, partial [Scleroderma citrinum Foug A]